MWAYTRTVSREREKRERMVLFLVESLKKRKSGGNLFRWKGITFLLCPRTSNSFPLSSLLIRVNNFPIHLRRSDSFPDQLTTFSSFPYYSRDCIPANLCECTFRSKKGFRRRTCSRETLDSEKLSFPRVPDSQEKRTQHNIGRKGTLTVKYSYYFSINLG